MTQYDQHRWIKTHKASCNVEKVKLLIELAIDVYNDSSQLTLSTPFSPFRSLSKIHADTQISSYKDDGLTSQFTQIEPSATILNINYGSGNARYCWEVCYAKHYR